MEGHIQEKDPKLVKLLADRIAIALFVAKANPVLIHKRMKMAEQLLDEFEITPLFPEAMLFSDR